MPGPVRDPGPGVGDLVRRLAARNGEATTSTDAATASAAEPPPEDAADACGADAARAAGSVPGTRARDRDRRDP